MTLYLMRTFYFTHRGLSGPAVLQISSFWHPGQEVKFDLFPNGDLLAELEKIQQSNPDMQLATALARIYPQAICTNRHSLLAVCRTSP